ncbi:unnamed protein product [Penicillium glandicola]
MMKIGESIRILAPQTGLASWVRNWIRPDSRMTGKAVDIQGNPRIPASWPPLYLSLCGLSPFSKRLSLQFSKYSSFPKFFSINTNPKAIIMSPRLLNKICLITGTGGSMGRAAALKFAQEGAKIVGCDINTVTDAATVEAVRELGGEMISMSPCDLTKRENCEQLVNLAIETYGRIDALYNNAAMAYMSWVDDGKDEDWYKTIDQELSLVYLLTRVAWPHLKGSGASIINVGSVNGWTAIRLVPGIAHTAAKGGVIAMTRQLAMEGRAHGIRANSISPGLIETLQTAPLLADPEWTESLLQQIMIGRIGQPEEVAAVASFLASDESSYITAADIRVDGGMTGW